jgi:hypothetical protein
VCKNAGRWQREVREVKKFAEDTGKIARISYKRNLTEGHKIKKEWSAKFTQSK